MLPVSMKFFPSSNSKTIYSDHDGNFSTLGCPVHNRFVCFVVTVLVVLLGSCCARSTLSQEPQSSGITLNTQQQSLPNSIVNPRVVVYKAARKLELYSDQKLLHTYRVGLGFNPVPDKQQEGDGATPEGDFYVFVKNPKSAYYLSLGLSYPNAEDAERGLRQGFINKTEHDNIIEAIRKKVAPPQYTKLGGLIYIHGHGAAKDWTLGCVALENHDIKELYDAVSVGTDVTIKP
jgi:murein L,D-transpeptidase YafK